jgi:hypothetical protein
VFYGYHEIVPIPAPSVIEDCIITPSQKSLIRILSGQWDGNAFVLRGLAFPAVYGSINPPLSGIIYLEGKSDGFISDVHADSFGGNYSGVPFIVDNAPSGNPSRINISNLRQEFRSGWASSGFTMHEAYTVEGRQLFDSLGSLEQFTGPKAITFAGSGYFQVAMAGVSGRMPAVGIAIASIISGDITSGDQPNEMGALVRYWGRVNSFAFDFSGYPYGQSIWVGQSGDLVLTPPTGSGMPQQIIGQVTDGSGMFVGNLCAGLVGSGQITQTMLASGVGGGATTWTTSYVAGEALSGGEFLVFSGAKIVTLAYASGTWDHASVVGVSAAAVLSGASIACETLCGRDVRVQMEASLSGLVAGKPVYLSALSRGACTTIAPTTSGNTSKLLGWISSTSGYLSGSVASSLLSIVFQPGQQILLG